jgi:DNA-binding NarL/FixJ family response regulator
MKILIVEKSFRIRKRLVRLLSYIGGIDTISVIAVSEEMLDHLSKSSCDLIIADVSAMDIITLNGVSKIKNKYHIKLLIVLADFYSPQIKGIYLEHGVDYFLDKTNEYEKLVKIIENVVNINRHKMVID